jgi:hypothetical protein
VVTFFRVTTGGAGGGGAARSVAIPTTEEEAPTGTFPMQCLGNTKDKGGCDATCVASPSSPPRPVDSTRRSKDTASALA